MSSSMDDLIRERFGRGPEPGETTGHEQPVCGDFDGGARETPPAPPPSMNSILRASIEDHRAARAGGITDRARQLDDLNQGGTAA